MWWSAGVGCRARRIRSAAGITRGWVSRQPAPPDAHRLEKQFGPRRASEPRAPHAFGDFRGGPRPRRWPDAPLGAYQEHSLRAAPRDIPIAVQPPWLGTWRRAP